MKGRSVSCRKKAHELLEKLIDAKNELWFLHLHTRKDRKSMNSKTLLLLGVVGAVAASTASAQVYSVNAVGYVNVTLPSGFSLISNPLNAPDNKYSALLPSVPIGTTIFKWTGSTYESSTFLGVWSDDSELVPGEGVFIQVSEPLTITFVGDVPQGQLVTQLPAGFSIKSSKVPQSAGLDALGFPADVGDSVYLFNRTAQSYDSFTFLGVWSPTVPTPAVGEAFFVQKTVAGSWTRAFSVN